MTPLNCEFSFSRLSRCVLLNLMLLVISSSLALRNLRVTVSLEECISTRKEWK